MANLNGRIDKLEQQITPVYVAPEPEPDPLADVKAAFEALDGGQQLQQLDYWQIEAAALGDNRLARFFTDWRDRLYLAGKLPAEWTNKELDRYYYLACVLSWGNGWNGKGWPPFWFDVEEEEPEEVKRRLEVYQYNRARIGKRRQ